MSDQDWSAPAPPPGPMPDGSIPLYASYPPPGTPGGGPALPQVGWGPDFGADGHIRHGGPQRKRRTGLVAGVLLLGGVGALVVIAALTLRSSNAPTVAPSYGPGAAPTSATAAPTEPDDSPPGTPGGPGASQDSAAIVRTDGFYRSGVQKTVNCREPQIALATAGAVQTYYANLIGCLNRAWTPLVRAGQDQYAAPRVIFWAGTVVSPCTSSSPTSFYCSANRTLYLKFEDDVKLWNRAPDDANRSFARMWATYTAGHEFGHHIQQLAGILPAAARLEYDAPDQDARLEVSRRIELQASCLGAAFMGANQASYGITGLDLTIYRRYVEAQTGDENNRGGPRDHGARSSHQYWAAQGFNTVNSANCNTFTASASKVS
ncbi:neutral zinc metallopeptidase [Kribbella italica]|uniref:Putative metalloprotease n=1 Tax=Kribbella italica TaxID=1540520 RepID=A0A7W9JE07_9ACTN|nr:putative metalloprotease [Kribbella italica]